MDSATARLPTPEPDELARSRRLASLIGEEIDAAGGWIGFERYMERALYEPGLGYYSSPGEKLGPGGDFVTAPELGDALARAAAASAAPWLDGLDSPVILELGAGLGTLAAQILDTLERRGAKPVDYRILEPSGALRRCQQEALAAHAGRVSWLDRLPDQPFEGLIVANEVADALPAARFVKQAGETVPLGVIRSGDGFDAAPGPAQDSLAEAVRALEAKLPAPLPDGYRSELRPVLPAWVDALARSLKRGAVLLVDYGGSRRECYHPERAAGTLICHYRHRAHDDPFLYPGLQDISAWVDFSACADAAAAAGLDVAGYTTQAQFLIGALGDALVGDAPTPQSLAALKTLIMPGEMGERFKTLLLTRGIDADLPGRDLRSRLGSEP